METADSLKEKLKCKTDAELGAIFGRGDKAVSVWRKNGLPASIERKAREILSVDHGRRPAEAFNIPLPSSKIPIVSWAQAGPDGFFEDSHATGSGFGEINRPYDVSDPQAYALIVSGDSMAPKYEAGEIIVVSPSAGVQTGDYAVVRLVDGSVMAKRVKSKNAHFVLESINPGFELIECRKEDIVFMHRIVWVKQRG